MSLQAYSVLQNVRKFISGTVIRNNDIPSQKNFERSLACVKRSRLCDRERSVVCTIFMARTRIIKIFDVIRIT